MLDRQQFFVKERTGMLKTADAYDILDPETQKTIGVAQEKPNMLMRILFKDKAPTSIEMRDKSEKLIFTVVKPFKFFGRPKIKVVDSANKEIGYFVSKMFSVGGGFHIYEGEAKHIGEVKGNWKSKEFQILTPQGKELGRVSKKFSGMAKELFTSADNYVVSVSDDANDDDTKILILAAALTIDMVLKE